MKSHLPAKFQELEDQANAFAFALLMPEEFVRVEVRRLGGVDLCDDRKIKKLADTFRMPTTIMAMRLGQIWNPK